MSCGEVSGAASTGGFDEAPGTPASMWNGTNGWSFLHPLHAGVDASAAVTPSVYARRETGRRMQARCTTTPTQRARTRPRPDYSSVAGVSMSLSIAPACGAQPVARRFTMRWLHLREMWSSSEKSPFPQPRLSASSARPQ